MFSKLDKNFLNYNYFKNFQYFNELNIDSNNNILNELYNSNNLEKQTKAIMKILFPCRYPFKQKTGIMEKAFSNSIMKKIDENHTLFIYKNDASIKFYNTKEENITIRLPFYDIISSIFVGENKIYLCILYVKVIKILEYNIKEENKYLKIIEEEIAENNNDDDNNYFNKCIEINNNSIITKDNENAITVWKKKISGTYFSYISKKVNNKLYDLLLINNNCFITCISEYKKVIFCDIENLNTTKTISNIDAIEYDDCITLFNNYIIINCKKGFAIVSKKTEEFVQYILNFFGYVNKKIYIFQNKIIYLISISSELSIMKIAFKDCCLVPEEEYKEIPLITTKKNYKINTFDFVPLININYIILLNNIFLLN